MHFDTTITMGNVMTLLGLLVAAGYFWAGMGKNVKAIEAWIAEHKEESKKSAEERVEMRLAYTKLESLVESHDAWIREIATPSLVKLNDTILAWVAGAKLPRSGN